MEEPPEESEDRSGDYEEDEPDMEDEYYKEVEPYHYAELERLRGIRDVEF